MYNGCNKGIDRLMAQLLQIGHIQEEDAVSLPEGFAAAINRQRLRLIANLSGSRTSYEMSESTLPASMTEPVSFDGSPDDGGLREVRLVPVDESEDDW
jgi:hypothetical protein